MLLLSKLYDWTELDMLERGTVVSISTVRIEVIEHPMIRPILTNSNLGHTHKKNLTGIS